MYISIYVLLSVHYFQLYTLRVSVHRKKHLPEGSLTSQLSIALHGLGILRRFQHHSWALTDPDFALMPARFSLIWRREIQNKNKRCWFECIRVLKSRMASLPLHWPSFWGDVVQSKLCSFSNVVSRGKQQLSKELLSPEWALDLASYPGQPALGSKFDPPERKLLRWRSLGYQIWKLKMLRHRHHWALHGITVVSEAKTVWVGLVSWFSHDNIWQRLPQGSCARTIDAPVWSWLQTHGRMQSCLWVKS